MAKLRTKISTKRINYDSKWNQQQKQPNQTQQSKQKHVRTQYISKHSDNSKIKKIILKTWKIKWDRENPYLFLEDWRRNDAKMNAFWSETWSVWETEMGKTVNSHKNSREKLKKKKNLKTVFETQNTRFSQLIQVASQSLGSPAKTLQAKSFKKI